MELEKEGMLVRVDSEVLFRETGVEVPSNNQEETILFRIKYNGHKFTIHPINTNPPNDRLWMVVRNFSAVGHKIQKHDIIKLGRMKFRVKEFRTEHEYFNELEEK